MPRKGEIQKEKSELCRPWDNLLFRLDAPLEGSPQDTLIGAKCQIVSKTAELSIERKRTYFCKKQALSETGFRINLGGAHRASALITWRGVMFKLLNKNMRPRRQNDFPWPGAESYQPGRVLWPSIQSNLTNVPVITVYSQLILVFLCANSWPRKISTIPWWTPAWNQYKHIAKKQGEEKHHQTRQTKNTHQKIMPWISLR